MFSFAFYGKFIRFCLYKNDKQCDVLSNQSLLATQKDMHLNAWF